MLKVHFFLNEPNGKPWKHFQQIMPRLGKKYPVEIEITAKPKAEYETDAYFALDLPVAPAIMVGDEIIVEGTDVSDHDLEVCICRQLGLPEPEKKGFFDRLLNKSWLIFISSPNEEITRISQRPERQDMRKLHEHASRVGSYMQSGDRNYLQNQRRLPSAEYLATGLPAAPALMLADEILVQGRPISEESLKSAVCQDVP